MVHWLTTPVFQLLMSMRVAGNLSLNPLCMPAQLRQDSLYSPTLIYYSNIFQAKAADNQDPVSTLGSFLRQGSLWQSAVWKVTSAILKHTCWTLAPADDSSDCDQRGTGS